MPADLGVVARADVEARPAADFKRIGRIGVGRTGVNHASVKCQTLHFRYFPFQANVGLGFSRADGAFAVS